MIRGIEGVSASHYYPKNPDDDLKHDCTQMWPILGSIYITQAKDQLAKIKTDFDNSSFKHDDRKQLALDDLSDIITNMSASQDS